MPTPKLGLEYIAAGQQFRETQINSNMDLIDELPEKRFVVLTLALGETVVGTGDRVGQTIVPYSPVDGVSAVTWNVRAIEVRLATAGTQTVRFQKSTAGVTAAFSATTIGDVAITALSGGRTTAALGTVGSGDVLRINIPAWTSGSGLTALILLEAS